VALTAAPSGFVTALTFQSLSGHPALTDYADRAGPLWSPHLARWAELYVLARPPRISRPRIMRDGDDAVTTSLLAFRGKVRCAAMNQRSTKTPSPGGTCARCWRIRGTGGGPDSGLLADGDVGPGTFGGDGDRRRLRARWGTLAGSGC
jgi:phosphopantothenoylcysteine decarboxylase/phosphopantothenate--cysteine ligase